MLEARLHGVRDLRVGEADRPVPTVDESLVRVTSVGICGSDLHWYCDGGIGGDAVARPLVPGHEFGGVVQTGPLAGQRVAVDPSISCGACPRCHEGNPNLCPGVVFAGHSTCDGALREYLSWPTRLLHPVPDTLTDDAVAMLEPLGVAIHSVDLGHLRPGRSAAVVGCGPIGLMLLQVARVAGAGPVLAVEPLPHRRRAAAGYGSGPAVDPAGDLAGALAEAGVPGGVDVAFEAAGSDAGVAAALDLVRPGGRVVLAGIPAGDTTRLPASVVRRKGLTLAWVRRMRDVYPRAIRLVAEGAVAVDPLVTGRFALADAPAAFVVAAQRAGIKTVITSSGAPPPAAPDPPSSR